LRLTPPAVICATEWANFVGFGSGAEEVAESEFALPGLAPVS
jgi:hypothetical protein